MKILYVCQANVGRSQMAEALHKKIYPEDIVSSAGTNVNGHEEKIIGRLEKAIHVIDAMKEEKIDLRYYKRKQLTEKMVEDAEKIIMITDPKNWPHFLVGNSKLEYWNILDPKGRDYQFHIKIKNEIKTKIERLLDYA